MPGGERAVKNQEDSFLATERALSEVGKQGYVPGKHHTNPPTMPSPIWISHNEFKSFEAAFKLLRKEHEKAKKHEEAYKLEMRHLRESCESQAKQLVISQRMFDKVLQEKKGLEQQARQNRSYIQKLEFKLTQDSKGHTMLEKNMELKERLTEAMERLEELKSVVASQNMDLQRAAKEIKTLQKALEVKLEGCGSRVVVDGVEEGSSVANLIRELAEKKVEAQSLALNLGEKDQTVESLQRQVGELHEALEKEYSTRLKLEETMGHLTRQLMSESEAALATRTKIEQLEGEKESLFRGIEAKSGQLVSLEKELVALSGEKDKMEKELKSRVEFFSRREWELLEEVEAMKEKVAKRITVQAMTEEKLAEERRRVKTVTECLLDKDVKLRDLHFEKKALLEEVESLNLKLADMSRRISKEEQQQTTLRNEREDMEGVLRQKLSLEQQMKREMDGLLEDLRKVTQERDEAVTQVRRLQEEKARQSAEQDHMGKAFNSQQQEIQTLQEAKSLLQKAMLEQLTATRAELQEEIQRRRVVEQELQQIKQHFLLAQKIAVEQPPQQQQGGGGQGEVGLERLPLTNQPPPPPPSISTTDNASPRGNEQEWGGAGATRGRITPLVEDSPSPASTPASSSSSRPRPTKETVTISIQDFEIRGLPPLPPDDVGALAPACLTCTLNGQTQATLGEATVLDGGQTLRWEGQALAFTDSLRVLRKPLQFKLCLGKVDEVLVAYQKVSIQEGILAKRCELPVDAGHKEGPLGQSTLVAALSLGGASSSNRTTPTATSRQPSLMDLAA